MKKLYTLFLLACCLPTLLLAQDLKLGEYRLITNEGKEVTSRIYELIIDRYPDKIAKGYTGGYTFLLDSLGNEFMPPFEGDISRQTYYESVHVSNMALRNKKWALMNTRFNLVTPFIYDRIDGLQPDRFAAKKEQLWAMIDSLGNELTPYIYDKIECYQDNFYTVYKDDQEGMMYRNGNMVLPLMKYNEPISLKRNGWIFRNKELSLVQVEIDKKVAVIDSTGYEVLPFSMDINNIHTPRINPKYYQIGNTFYEKYGLMSLDAKVFIQPAYDEIYTIEDTTFVGVKNGTYSYIDSNGNVRLTSQERIKWSLYAHLEVKTDSIPLYYDSQANRLEGLKHDPSKHKSYYWYRYIGFTE